MELRDKKIIAALFLSSFVAIEVGDHFAGLLMQLGVTLNIDGLAGFLSHSCVGIAYGYAFHRASKEKFNFLMLMLPLMMLLGGAVRSAVFFLLDDRTFYISKWLPYILTSHFGFEWLIVIPGAAYIATKRFGWKKS